jgi:hypothetical protein
MWEDPVLRRRLVASGRERVLDRLGEAESLSAWRGVVEEVLA